MLQGVCQEYILQSIDDRDTKYRPVMEENRAIDESCQC